MERQFFKKLIHPYSHKILRMDVEDGLMMNLNPINLDEKYVTFFEL